MEFRNDYIRIKYRMLLYSFFAFFLVYDHHIYCLLISLNFLIPTRKCLDCIVKGNDRLHVLSQFCHLVGSLPSIFLTNPTFGNNIWSDQNITDCMHRHSCATYLARTGSQPLCSFRKSLTFLFLVL